jgi:hypothetical protein
LSFVLPFDGGVSVAPWEAAPLATAASTPVGEETGNVPRPESLTGVAVVSTAPASAALADPASVASPGPVLPPPVLLPPPPSTAVDPVVGVPGFAERVPDEPFQ